MTSASAFSSLNRGLVVGAFITLALALSGCDRTPTNDMLMSDVGAYVESGYAPGLMDIIRVERLDHRILPNFISNRRTIRAHRVSLAALGTALDELPIDEALAALKRGERDAVILTAPAPSPALRDFAIANAVRLLPMDADAVALLTTGTSNYVVVTVPAQTYPGQGRPVTTVGVAALLVSSELVPAPEAAALLQKVFTDLDYMHEGSPFNAMVKVGSAHRGVTLPLHSAAEAFYAAVSNQK